MMDDAIGLAEVLSGTGLFALTSLRAHVEVVMWIESTATRAFCWSCGRFAEAQDRMRVDYVRDLARFGSASAAGVDQAAGGAVGEVCGASDFTGV